MLVVTDVLLIDVCLCESSEAFLPEIHARMTNEIPTVLSRPPSRQDVLLGVKEEGLVTTTRGKARVGEAAEPPQPSTGGGRLHVFACNLESFGGEPSSRCLGLPSLLKPSVFSIRFVRTCRTDQAHGRANAHRELTLQRLSQGWKAWKQASKQERERHREGETELEQKRKQGRKKAGRKKGRKEGRKDGRTEGRKDGRTEGRKEEGRQQGRQEHLPYLEQEGMHSAQATYSCRDSLCSHLGQQHSTRIPPSPSFVGMARGSWILSSCSFGPLGRSEQIRWPTCSNSGKVGRAALQAKARRQVGKGADDSCLKRFDRGHAVGSDAARGPRSTKHIGRGASFCQGSFYESFVPEPSAPSVCGTHGWKP